MTDTYTGQIMMAGFNLSPSGFAGCDGQALNVNQNQALYALIGITYGGTGGQQGNFNLPDLRGRTPVGGYPPDRRVTRSADYVEYTLGQKGGAEQVTLTADQNPRHTHQLVAAATAGVNQYMDGALLLAPVSDPARLYGPANSTVRLGGSFSNQVGGLAHNNVQPYEVINFLICLAGDYPPRS